MISATLNWQRLLELISCFSTCLMSIILFFHGLRISTPDNVIEEIQELTGRIVGSILRQ